MEGAQAIVLREATRRAGVTARAAYRHFADREALVRAVAGAALTEMAATITRHQAGASDGLSMLRGVGEGYIQFALDEPGWFDVAFFAMGDLVHPSRSPYHQLEEALALLVEPSQVGGAAIACWSGVHGFATLATRGPLRALPRSVVDARGRELVDQLCDSVLSRPSPRSS